MRSKIAWLHCWIECYFLNRQGPWRLSTFAELIDDGWEDTGLAFYPKNLRLTPIVMKLLHDRLHRICWWEWKPELVPFIGYKPTYRVYSWHDDHFEIWRIHPEFSRLVKQ